MRQILIATVILTAALGAGWAQDGEKKKEAPKAEGVSNEGFLTLDQVDTNGDGKVTRAELEAALKKMGGAGRKDGEGAKKEGARDGDAAKKEGVKRDGDGAKKEGARDGEKKPVERKEGDK